MAGLNDVIAGALKAVASTKPVKDLSETFTQKVFVGETSAALPQYNPTTVTLTAVRSSVNIVIPREGGREDVASDRLDFIGDVSIKLRDRIVFADGTAGDVLRVKGTTNPATGRPYSPTVYVGTRAAEA